MRAVLAVIAATAAALAVGTPSQVRAGVQRHGAAGPDRYLDPAWSPDGKRIAFVKWARYPYDASSLYVVNRDGTGLRRLRSMLRAAGSPTWSPDGRRIAFSEARGLFVMNADGSRPRLIADRAANPDWGPGGRKIAYEVPGFTSVDTTRIYLITPDGRQNDLIADPSATRVADAYIAPTWSSDGQRLLFVVAKINNAGFEPIRSFLAVVDSPGGRVRDLLDGDYEWYPPTPEPLDGLGWDPDWSPDGQQIALWTNSGVSVLTLRTHRLQLLDAQGHRPRWSPDGRRIVYIRRDAGEPNEKIYVINANGSNRRQLVP